MKELSNLIKKVKILEKDIFKLESELENHKDELKHYLETVIPDILMSNNISKITINGYNLRIAKTYFVSYKDEEKVVKWFQDKGLDIFKREVIVNCPSEEYKELLTTQLALSDYKYKISHHWKTMSAQMEQLVNNGIDIPEFLNVTEVTKTYIYEVK